MALELHFSKLNASIPWGFRVTGGADYEFPLVIVKVNENSLAEQNGLLENDIIVRINDTATAGLSHIQAHELLLSAGNNFVLGIRRGDYIGRYSVADDEEGNAEVSQILMGAIAEEEQSTQNQRVFEPLSVNCTETNQNEAEVISLSPSENLAGQEEIIYPNVRPLDANTNIVIPPDIKDRKWSTFLQKPKNPVPKPKRSEPEIPKGEQYRVIIKKQKRKTEEEKLRERQLKAELARKAAEESEESPLTIENEEINVNTENAPDKNISNSEVDENAENEGAESWDSEEILEDVEENHQDDEENVEHFSDEEESVERRRVHFEDEVPQPTPIPNLEEQLIQVQKQLLALAQIPSEVRDTLAAVTQQLAKIVPIKDEEEQHGEDNDEASTTTEDDITEPIANEGDEVHSDNENELEHDHIASEIENEDTYFEREEEQDENEILEEQVYEPTYEELLAQQMKEERIAKQAKELEKMEEFQQRRLEQRPTMPLKPVERPIILPGGTKWVDPEDACAKPRNKKMTDEKIADTIETYSEVIVGKTKGINFLKYQPPPKNLDFLQRSEVYRLVHDMEPPTKGVSIRAEKILSEEDYHQVRIVLK